MQRVTRAATLEGDTEVTAMRNVRDLWKRWRESSRQYAIERAMYKAGGGQAGAPHSRAVEHGIKSGAPPPAEGGGGTGL